MKISVHTPFYQELNTMTASRRACDVHTARRLQEIRSAAPWKLKEQTANDYFKEQFNLTYGSVCRIIAVAERFFMPELIKKDRKEERFIYYSDSVLFRLLPYGDYDNICKICDKLKITDRTTLAELNAKLNKL